MLLHSIGNRPALQDISSDLLISLHLRLYEIQRFLRQVLWDADDSVDICNQYIPRIDDGLLVLAVQPDGSIDLVSSATDILLQPDAFTYLAHPDNLLRSCRTDVSREHLHWPSASYYRDQGLVLYRISQIAMLLQIPQPPVNHRPNRAQILRSRTHQTSIARIDHPRRSRNEHNCSCWDAVNLANHQHPWRHRDLFMAYIVSRRLGLVLVILSHISNRIRRSDSFGWPFLSFR